jgi:hypothetical protein
MLAFTSNGNIGFIFEVLVKSAGLRNFCVLFRLICTSRIDVRILAELIPQKQSVDSSYLAETPGSLILQYHAENKQKSDLLSVKRRSQVDLQRR